jgi:hypothetical protein
MNIRPALGTSYRLESYGPFTSAFRRRRFYVSYRHACRDATWSFTKFSTLIGEGTIVCTEVIDTHGTVVARYGLEVMHDQIGNYVNILFLEGVGFHAYSRLVIEAIWQAARSLSEDPRAYLGGRQKAWKRFLKKHGIRFEGCFICGRQEAFGHGRR